MAKIKIIDVAKAKKWKAPVLVDAAKKLGIDVLNALSYIEESDIDKVIKKAKEEYAKNNKNQRTNSNNRFNNREGAPRQGGENAPKRYNNRNNPNQANSNSRTKTNTNNADRKPGGSNTFNKNANGQNRSSKNTVNDIIPAELKTETTKKSNHNTSKAPKVEVKSKFKDDISVLSTPNKKNKTAVKEVVKVLELTKGQDLTVSELSQKINVNSSDIIKQLFLLGVMATQTQVLELEAIEIICAEYDIEIKEIVVVDETDLNSFDIALEDETHLEKRPPVITIMGHVDHGKTSLLDAIRSTRVTAGEAGGITQHIGAYQVEKNGEIITFIDTPGHAAFSAMRARGSHVTDIVILVVAADDSVKPQTIEAIDHAKAANVPIIVAVNKIDKPGANPERVMTDLSEYGLVPEMWGGKTIFVNTSAHSKEGIDELLEMILLESEMLELKANPHRYAVGTVLEARVEKGRGVVADVLVQKGTLKVRESVVAGHSYGKIRTISNDLGKHINHAGPSTPIEITGLNDVPDAGDRFVVFTDDKKAKSISETINSKRNESRLREQAKVSVDSLFEKISEQELKEINVIIKTDVKGSAEALQGMLSVLKVDDVRVKVIRSEVGTISESDVILASASDAIIIGFNVRPNQQVREVAKREGVDIRLHSIVYKVVEELQDAMNGMLEPVFEEKIVGSAEIRQLFKASKVGTIAGTMVTEGVIKRNSLIRLIRDGVVLVDGELGSLKRVNDDVKEVRQGFDCGLTVKDFNDVKEGDIIEAYEMVQI